MKIITLLLATVLVIAPVSTLAAPAPASTEWNFSRTGMDIHIGSEIEQDVLNDEENIVNSYRVRKGTLTSNERTSDKVEAGDFAIWKMFEGIAGKKTITSYMGNYVTYRDAKESTLALVARLSKDSKSWVLAVNANNSNAQSWAWRRDMAVILVHEYAHILTLNKTQIRSTGLYDKKCKKIDTVDIARFGCTNPESYLNQFVARFWSVQEIADAKAAAEQGKTLKYYEKHSTEFTTKYAASNPLEDIAESFTDFVLRTKPTGTLEKDQKILFFYEYPELVKLRTEIRANIAQYF